MEVEVTLLQIREMLARESSLLGRDRSAFHLHQFSRGLKERESSETPHHSTLYLSIVVIPILLASAFFLSATFRLASSLLRGCSQETEALKLGAAIGVSLRKRGLYAPHTIDSPKSTYKESSTGLPTTDSPVVGPMDSKRKTTAISGFIHFDRNTETIEIYPTQTRIRIRDKRSGNEGRATKQSFLSCVRLAPLSLPSTPRARHGTYLACEARMILSCSPKKIPQRASRISASQQLRFITDFYVLVESLLDDNNSNNTGVPLARSANACAGDASLASVDSAGSTDRARSRLGLPSLVASGSEGHTEVLKSNIGHVISINNKGPHAHHSVSRGGARGSLHSVEGDVVVLSFGVKSTDLKHEESACRAARDIRTKVTHYGMRCSPMTNGNNSVVKMALRMGVASGTVRFVGKPFCNSAHYASFYEVSDAASNAILLLSFSARLRVTAVATEEVSEKGHFHATPLEMVYLPKTVGGASKRRAEQCLSDVPSNEEQRSDFEVSVCAFDQKNGHEGQCARGEKITLYHLHSITSEEHRQLVKQYYKSAVDEKPNGGTCIGDPQPPIPPYGLGASNRDPTTSSTWLAPYKAPVTPVAVGLGGSLGRGGRFDRSVSFSASVGPTPVLRAKHGPTCSNAQRKYEPGSMNDLSSLHEESTKVGSDLIRPASSNPLSILGRGFRLPPTSTASSISSCSSRVATPLVAMRANEAEGMPIRFEDVGRSSGGVQLRLTPFRPPALSSGVRNDYPNDTESHMPSQKGHFVSSAHGTAAFGERRRQSPVGKLPTSNKLVHTHTRQEAPQLLSAMESAASCTSTRKSASLGHDRKYDSAEKAIRVSAALSSAFYSMKRGQLQRAEAELAIFCDTDSPRIVRSWRRKCQRARSYSRADGQSAPMDELFGGRYVGWDSHLKSHKVKKGIRSIADWGRSDSSDDPNRGSALMASTSASAHRSSAKSTLRSSSFQLNSQSRVFTPQGLPAEPFPSADLTAHQTRARSASSFSLSCTPHGARGFTSGCPPPLNGSTEDTQPLLRLFNTSAPALHERSAGESSSARTQWAGNKWDFSYSNNHLDQSCRMHDQKRSSSILFTANNNIGSVGSAFHGRGHETSAGDTDSCGFVGSQNVVWHSSSNKLECESFVTPECETIVFYAGEMPGEGAERLPFGDFKSCVAAGIEASAHSSQAFDTLSEKEIGVGLKHEVEDDYDGDNDDEDDMGSYFAAAPSWHQAVLEFKQSTFVTVTASGQPYSDSACTSLTPRGSPATPASAWEGLPTVDADAALYWPRRSSIHTPSPCVSPVHTPHTTARRAFDGYRYKPRDLIDHLAATKATGVTPAFAGQAQIGPFTMPGSLLAAPTHIATNLTELSAPLTTIAQPRASTTCQLDIPPKTLQDHERDTSRLHAIRTDPSEKLRSDSGMGSIASSNVEGPQRKRSPSFATLGPSAVSSRSPRAPFGCDLLSCNSLCVNFVEAIAGRSGLSAPPGYYHQNPSASVGCDQLLFSNTRLLPAQSQNQSLCRSTDFGGVGYVSLFAAGHDMETSRHVTDLTMEFATHTSRPPCVSQTLMANQSNALYQDAFDSCVRTKRDAVEFDRLGAGGSVLSSLTFATPPPPPSTNAISNSLKIDMSPFPGALFMPCVLPSDTRNDAAVGGPQNGLGVCLSLTSPTEARQHARGSIQTQVEFPGTYTYSSSAQEVSASGNAAIGYLLSPGAGSNLHSQGNPSRMPRQIVSALGTSLGVGVGFESVHMSFPLNGVSEDLSAVSGFSMTSPRSNLSEGSAGSSGVQKVGHGSAGLTPLSALMPTAGALGEGFFTCSTPRTDRRADGEGSDDDESTSGPLGYAFQQCKAATFFVSTSSEVGTVEDSSDASLHTGLQVEGMQVGLFVDYKNPFPLAFRNDDYCNNLGSECNVSSLDKDEEELKRCTLCDASNAQPCSSMILGSPHEPAGSLRVVEKAPTEGMAEDQLEGKPRKSAGCTEKSGCLPPETAKIMSCEDGGTQSSHDRTSKNNSLQPSTFSFRSDINVTCAISSPHENPEGFPSESNAGSLIYALTTSDGSSFGPKGADHAHITEGYPEWTSPLFPPSSTLFTANAADASEGADVAFLKSTSGTMNFIANRTIERESQRGNTVVPKPNINQSVPLSPFFFLDSGVGAINLEEEAAETAKNLNPREELHGIPATSPLLFDFMLTSRDIDVFSDLPERAARESSPSSKGAGDNDGEAHTTNNSDDDDDGDDDFDPSFWSRPRGAPPDIDSTRKKERIKTVHKSAACSTPSVAPPLSKMIPPHCRLPRAFHVLTTDGTNALTFIRTDRLLHSSSGEAVSDEYYRSSFVKRVKEGPHSVREQKACHVATCVALSPLSGKLCSVQFISARALGARSAADLLAVESQVAFVAQRLDHPNVMKIDSFGTEEWYLWLKAKSIPLSSLRSVLRSATTCGGAVPFCVARLLLRDALKGLEYLHKSGVVHGLLRPECLVLNSEGSCMLSDAGLSRIVLAPKPELRHTKIPARLSGTASECGQFAGENENGPHEQEFYIETPYARLATFAARRRLLGLGEADGASILEYMPPWLAAQCSREGGAPHEPIVLHGDNTIYFAHASCSSWHGCSSFSEGHGPSLNDCSPHNDLYSLGLIFFEMLTGLSPWQARNGAESASSREPCTQDNGQERVGASSLGSSLTTLLPRAYLDFLGGTFPAHPSHEPHTVSSFMSEKDGLFAIQTFARDAAYFMLNDDSHGQFSASQILAALF